MSFIMVDTRWQRDWRFRGRSVLTISFSYNMRRTRVDGGSMHLYLGRLRLQWQMRPRGVGVEVYLSRKVKPIEQWTAAEKAEVGLVDVGVKPR